MKKKLKRILLVDDNDAANYFHKRIIIEAGVAEQIQIAQTAEDALDYLTNQRAYKQNGHDYPCPDLIFLDINMPGMNGWEFLELFSRLPIEQKSKIVIIILTTSLNPDDEKRAKGIEEISMFMRKSLTQEKLNDMLNKKFPDNF